MKQNLRCACIYYLLGHKLNSASKASKKEDQSFIISGFAGLLTGTEKMEKSEQGEYERLD